MPFYLEMSKNTTQQRDIYDIVIFRFLQIYINLPVTAIVRLPNHQSQRQPGPGNVLKHPLVIMKRTPITQNFETIIHPYQY